MGTAWPCYDAHAVCAVLFCAVMSLLRCGSWFLGAAVVVERLPGMSIRPARGA